MAIRTLMDGTLKVTILTAPPADPEAITLAELEAGIDATCDLAKAGTRFSPTASDTITDTRLCDEANVSALGASNYEVSMAVYWLIDPATKRRIALDNPTFEAVKTKGATVWPVLREDGQKATDDWDAGDDYELWEFTSDNPQRPTESTGYHKRIIPGQGQLLAEGVVTS